MIPLHAILITIFYIYLGITILYLLLDNRDASTTLSWLLVFILFPFVGFGFYCIFGRGMTKRAKKRLIKQNTDALLSSVPKEVIARQQEDMRVLDQKCSSPGKRKLMRLLNHSSHSILARHNDVEVFMNGTLKFEKLFKDIADATHYIHMEYYIWKDDSLTQKIVQALAQKVSEGVKVRILYDVIGHYLSHGYLKRLRAMGIDIYPYYNYLSPFKIHTLNYRNHRKIAVIDGRIGYTGGMNMAEEYANGGKRFPSWRDTHMRIQGESVAVLEGIFAVGWLNTTKEKIENNIYLATNDLAAREVPLQITMSGPDSEWESIKQLYFLLISSAEKTICIHTPYFVPDPSIVMALKTAALSGIEVRIILTGLLDKRLPYWVALTYLKDLLKAGVEFYYYTAGFMHAKTIVIDSEICSIGTANMDIRSLQLNYEINALIFDERIAKELAQQFETDIASSRKYTLAEHNAMSKAKQLRNSLVRLFSPLV